MKASKSSLKHDVTKKETSPEKASQTSRSLVKKADDRVAKGGQSPRGKDVEMKSDDEENEEEEDFVTRRKPRRLRKARDASDDSDGADNNSKPEGVADGPPSKRGKTPQK